MFINIQMKTEYESSRKNESEHKTSGHDYNDDRRRNPRLVFSDPDEFFHDLLMEQQENH